MGIDEFIAKVNEYKDMTDELLESKNRTIEFWKTLASVRRMRIAALEVLLCRSIKGDLSEEVQKEILNKFEC